MIYLIDDKISRQKLLGWNQERLEKYESIVKPVYSYKQIRDENLRSIDNIFSNQSIILFHESFFEQVTDSNKSDSLKIRNELINWCIENEIPLVKFSGSINTRIQNGVNVSLSVKILYQNLEFFLKSIDKKDSIDKSLQILLFGENYNIEEILQLKKEIWETKFKFTPVFDTKIKYFNTLTNKTIDFKVTPNPTVLKTLINE